MRNYIDKTKDEREHADFDESSLDHALRKLEYLTRILRMTGLYVFTSTVFCLVLSFLTILRIAPTMAIFKIILYLAIGFGGVSLVLVIFYESYRKQGEALFEEISDELQWHIRFVGDNEKRSTSDVRPGLEARVVLRFFARATDLPLVPGRFGPAVYVMVNIVALLAAGWTFRYIL
jgi:hypothetical protein